MSENKSSGSCVSFYQIARSWNIPYEVAKRLFRAELQGAECTTTTGAPGIPEPQLKRFRKTFKIVQTENGRWVLKTKAQLKLFLGV